MIPGHETYLMVIGIGRGRGTTAVDDIQLPVYSLWLEQLEPGGQDENNTY